MRGEPILTPIGHLVMSKTFLVEMEAHGAGENGTSIWWVEARDVVKYPPMYRATLHNSFIQSKT